MPAVATKFQENARELVNVGGLTPRPGRANERRVDADISPESRHRVTPPSK